MSDLRVTVDRSSSDRQVEFTVHIHRVSLSLVKHFEQPRTAKDMSDLAGLLRSHNTAAISAAFNINVTRAGTGWSPDLLFITPAEMVRPLVFPGYYQWTLFVSVEEWAEIVRHMTSALEPPLLLSAKPSIKPPILPFPIAKSENTATRL